MASGLADLDGPGRPSNSADRQDFTTRAEAAELLNTSERLTNRAAVVREHGVEELQDAVESGAVRVGPAERIARMPAEEQPAAVEAAKAHVAHNSGNNEWYTPEAYIEAARGVLGGIALDPASCAEANAVVKAARFYSEAENGLTKRWKGTVWMNPPYAQPLIGQFAHKLVEELGAGNVTAAVVLVNNATETAFFQELAAAASAICFPKGRIRFWAPGGGEGAPLQGQAVLYFGAESAAFVSGFAGFGLVLINPAK